MRFMLTTEAEDYGRTERFIEVRGGRDSSPSNRKYPRTYPKKTLLFENERKAFVTE
jgi:hypothetical protein